MRDLFTTRVCLGVTTASHVDMVLGDGARDRGALADEIPGDPRHAGIGFTIDPITRLPVRFRAAYVTDPDIDELVTDLPPRPQPGDVINPARRRSDDAATAATTMGGWRDVGRHRLGARHLAQNHRSLLAARRRRPAGGGCGAGSADSCSSASPPPSPSCM